MRMALILSFLSTLSLRRATRQMPLIRFFLGIFLSTLSLRRATAVIRRAVCAYYISIHALLAESDVEEVSGDTWTRDFYPRSPCGERRQVKQTCRAKISISIHALLAESDSPPSVTPAASRNFYPRSPCGERPNTGKHFKIIQIFLSTLSLRRATRQHSEPDSGRMNFYPRSPCGERLNANLGRHRRNNDFYPRSPCGERLIREPTAGRSNEFLSTLSLRRATTVHQ